MSVEPLKNHWEYQAADTWVHDEGFVASWDPHPPYPVEEGEEQWLRDMAKQAERREKNRQAAARYRQRKEDLLAHLQRQNKQMEEEIKHLESRLQNGMEELARLKARRGYSEYWSIQ